MSEGGEGFGGNKITWFKRVIGEGEGERNSWDFVAWEGGGERERRGREGKEGGWLMVCLGLKNILCAELCYYYIILLYYYFIIQYYCIIIVLYTNQFFHVIPNE